jgi:hypothetical protein
VVAVLLEGGEGGKQVLQKPVEELREEAREEAREGGFVLRKKHQGRQRAKRDGEGSHSVVGRKPGREEGKEGGREGLPGHFPCRRVVAHTNGG